jgi:hypothetical protein
MKMLFLRRAFLGLIAAASLSASIQNLAVSRELGSLTEDPVADWEKRFAAVRQRIPFVRGVVGYISDSDIPGATYDPANDEGEYILTQYALAPLVLVRGADQEWNIANLSRDSLERWQMGQGADFDIAARGAGIYLMHRRAE